MASIAEPADQAENTRLGDILHYRVKVCDSDLTISRAQLKLKCYPISDAKTRNSEGEDRIVTQQ